LIRIVGVQRSQNIGEEFVLLQNQGSMRQNLRGHLLLSETSYSGTPKQVLFLDEIYVGPGQFVMVRSGSGDSGWKVSKDGTRMYCHFAQQSETQWGQAGIHILHVQHSYCERVHEALLA
jgi:hypothetical protein